MTNKKVEKRLVCVWLDNQLTKSVEYVDTQEQLRDIINDFRTYRDSNLCLDFITKTTDAKIVFITSNVLGKLLVPTIHSFEQLHSIYIFHTKKLLDEEWTKDFNKIKGIFNDVTLIYDQFKKDTTIIPTPSPSPPPQTTATVSNGNEQNDTIAITFASSSDINSNDINRQDPSFMYFQLLKDIILNDRLFESDEQTKVDMISYCRKIYHDCPISLDVLDQFEKDFIPELSIYWYTKECFLYKMLNKALWTPEPDVLYKLRYFIRHLYHQISSEAAKQRQHFSSTIIVYRGQSMTKDQVEKLKRNVGGFLSFNNFLSTTLKQDVAMNFVLGLEIGVIFEMEIDPKIQKFPFINIENISYLQKDECEQELLFGIGSVFRIVNIDKQKDVYRVQLRLSGDVDGQLAAYTKVTRDKTRTFYSFFSLLKLMGELQQYNCIDRFAEIVYDDVGLCTNPSMLASVHHTFGLLYLNRQQYKESLKHSQKSLEIHLNNLSADHATLTVTYNNVGCAYVGLGDYAKALEYQQLALDCELNSDNPNVSSLILYRNNIGKIYGYQRKYNEALEQHKEALELQKVHLGENDPSLGETYNLISSMYRKQGDFEQAGLNREKAVVLQEVASKLDPTAAAEFSIKTGTDCLSRKQYEDALVHFKHALEMQQQFLLPNHPSIAKTFDHIAKTYYDQDRFEEALPYYKNSLEIEQNSYPDDHPSIAVSYYNISTAYLGLSNWFEALEYGLKAVEQSKKILQTDVETLALYVKHVAHIFYKQEQYQEALIYYQEALELYHSYLSEDNPLLFGVYYEAGKAYYNVQMYAEALNFYQKTFNMAANALPESAKEIGNMYLDLSCAYLGLKQYDEALITAEQAIEQLRKTMPNNHPEVVQFRVHLDVVKQRQISENGCY